jgi:hypothetical protein
MRIAIMAVRNTTIDPAASRSSREYPNAPQRWEFGPPLFGIAAEEDQDQATQGITKGLAAFALPKFGQCCVIPAGPGIIDCCMERMLR